MVQSNGGRPIAGAFVQLTHVDHDFLPPEAWDAYGSLRTDGEGRFAFDHVPAGPFELIASVDRMQGMDGPRATMSLRLEDGAAVEDLVLRLP